MTRTSAVIVLCALTSGWIGSARLAQACGDAAIGLGGGEKKIFERSGQNMLVRFTADGVPYELTDDDGVASLMLVYYAVIHARSVNIDSRKESWDTAIGKTPPVSKQSVPDWSRLKIVFAAAAQRVGPNIDMQIAAAKKEYGGNPADAKELAAWIKKQEDTKARLQIILGTLVDKNDASITFAELNKLGEWVDGNRSRSYPLKNLKSGEISTVGATWGQTRDDKELDNTFAGIFESQRQFALPVIEKSRCAPQGQSFDARVLADSYILAIK